MDQTQLQEKIAEYCAKLPKEAQEFFASMEWMKTLESISEKYKLDEGQRSILGTETMLVLLGIIHHVEFEQILERELQISPEITEKLTLEVDDLVLKKVKTLVTNAYHKNNQTESTEDKEEVKPEETKDELEENISFILKGGKE